MEFSKRIETMQQSPIRKLVPIAEDAKQKEKAERFCATEGLGKDRVRISYVLNEYDLKNAMNIMKEELKVYPRKKNKTPKGSQ